MGQVVGVERAIPGMDVFRTARAKRDPRSYLAYQRSSARRQAIS